MEFLGYGARLTLSNTTVRIERGLLARGRHGAVTEIPLAQVKGIASAAPSALVPGFIELLIDDAKPTNGAAQPRTLLNDSAQTMWLLSSHAKVIDELPAALEQARAGELSDELPPLAELAHDTRLEAATEAGAAGTDTDTRTDAETAVNFVAVDVETANDQLGSICQIGAAVVRGGKVTDTYSWLCRPPAGLEHFDEANIGVHGIRPSDIATEPTFLERFNELKAVVGDAPLVAHNAAFDMGAFKDAAKEAGAQLPDWQFGCTLMWARRAAPGLQNYKLPTVAAAAGQTVEKHHDAREDAIASAEIALWLMAGDYDYDPARYSASIRYAMGRLSPAGLVFVHNAGGPAGGKTTIAPANAAPKQQRRAKWDAAKTPDAIPETNEDANPDHPLFGANVTLTGDFAPHDKGELWNLIARAGGTVGKNVTKKTTILVAGPWDSVTSKQKRAEELQAKGQEIEIWTANQLLDVLGLTEEPPF